MMKKINPIHYRIHLEPDMKRFKLSGNVTIDIEVPEPLNNISVHALELTVLKVWIQSDGDPVACPFEAVPEKEQLRIMLPHEISGHLTLTIHYQGDITDRMSGFYRSRYQKGDETAHIAVTQFEESDARRAFPCFDHPSLKATFDVEMVIHEDMTAISNGPLIEEGPLGSGKKLVRFQRTPKMSTYLLFFSVGEFEFLEQRNHIVFRVATVPGRTKYGRFGLDFGKKALAFCEAFFGIAYPLPKLDLIAVPDFAFGAMENWGAIAFRENLLLHYPNVTSKAGEERICEVIAHEIAHQWFGNLVSPSDWRYLWLNESFATYFGYTIAGHYYPEWDVWDQFLNGQTAAALDRDAMKETFPIEIPGGEHVVINASTAPIIYNKGGSMLRQIATYVGDESFRQGLEGYLNRHAYGCASSRHLWEALEDASDKPVTRIMKSWVEQQGFPIVEVRREDNGLLLTQGRFTYLPNDADQTWWIPVTVRTYSDRGDSNTVTTLLKDRQTWIPMDEDAVAYKVNDRQAGFYRVRYHNRTDHLALGLRVRNKELASEDRWGLQSDLYAQVMAAEVSIEEYLEFLSNYEEEDAFLPLMGISENLFHAYCVGGSTQRRRVADEGCRFLTRILDRIGYAPERNERHTRSILRDRILYPAVIYGSRQAREFAQGQFRSLMAGGHTVHPDIIKAVMQVGALNGDEVVFEWFTDRLESSESEHDRINGLTALGCFREKGQIAQAQNYTLERVPLGNRFIPIVSMASNPHASPLMWDWFVSHLSELERFHPVHFERVIAGIVPVCGLGREAEVTEFLMDYLAGKDLAKDVIRLSIERLETNSRIRNR